MNYRPNPLLYGSNENFYGSFRIAVTMRSCVDYDVLSRSVEKAMVRYPYFSVSCEKDTKNMLLLEVMTIGEDFSITFMQSGRGRRYVDAFIEQLNAFDIPVNLVGEGRYSHCVTRIPQ